MINRRWFLQAVTAVAAVVVGLLPKSKGYVFNAELNHKSNFTFQSDGQIETVVGVFDGGSELKFEGDDVSVEVLMKRDIKPGCYRTCLSSGHIRLGAEPAFPVTIDAVGNGLVSRKMTRRELAGISFENGRAAKLDQAGLLC